MTKFLILLILQLNTENAFAQKYWVKFGKEQQSLMRQKDGFISPNCEKCEAIKAMTTSIKHEASELIDKNPGSIKCEKLKGKVRIGKLYSGHSQSFCFFADKSFLSTNLLN